MIYLLYLVLVPVSLITTLVGVILAPLMALFKVQKLWWCNNHNCEAVGPVLPSWLNWFNTPDNTLDGDATFQRLNGISYWSKVKWLWRNPAYSFALRYIHLPYSTECYGDPTIKDNDNAKAGWCFIKANGLFQFVYIKRIFSTSRCIYVCCGWGIRGLVDDNVVDKPNPWMATFVFSPRISGFR